MNELGERVATSITMEMKTQLQKQATSEQRSLASLIRFILQRYLEAISSKQKTE